MAPAPPVTGAAAAAAAEPIARSPSAFVTLIRRDDSGSPFGPRAAYSLLRARDGAPPPQQPNYDQGVTHVSDMNNTAIFVLFGLIGMAFVLTMIWFFFWAKNGGFYFKKNDWDEYKSTVLRRKGPNGTILSNATPSTDLGGGSVYKDIVDDENTTVVSGTTVTSRTQTEITGGVSDIAGRERKRMRREKKDREKAARDEEKRQRRQEKKDRKHNRHVDQNGNLVDEDAEREAKQHLRDYRHERPARVGGLNKQSDGSAWDGSTNPASSNMSDSHGGSGSTSNGGTESDLGLLAHRERTPTTTPTGTPTKKNAASSGGIRKVYSTADRNAERESERIRAEARRLTERGRNAPGGNHPSRRDFSFQRAESSIAETNLTGNASRRLEDAGARNNRVPGSWAPAESDIASEVASDFTTSDLGTKSYRCHIPGLSSSSGVGSGSGSVVGSEYADERRKKRASRASGYRRGGGDGFTDVDIS